MKYEIVKTAADVLVNMENIFLSEEDKVGVSGYNVEDTDVNFLISYLVALKLHFEGFGVQMEGASISSMDLVEFTHFLNKLAILYITEQGGVE